MADSPTEAPHSANPMQAPAGPSSNRRSIASIVQVAFLVIFGGIGYFGIWALKFFGILEDTTGSLDVALIAGGLLVGVIIGGILGAKAKQAILK